jgi:pyruvate-formate lyase-activating enzyme
MIHENRIRNIRYGLATNSSSTHSIIHNAQEARRSMDEYCDDASFGWDFFTCATKECKENYMLLQLMNNVRELNSPLEFIAEKKGFKDLIEPLTSGYVDHQSVIGFPRDKYGERLCMGFFKDYYNYIVDGDFIILGGNDNDDASHPLSGQDDCTNSFMYDFERDDIAFENGNYWVVRNNKRKMRIAFHDGTLSPVVPELIDLKITDYCDMGCDFCYQGSTEEGMHAALDDILGCVGKYSSNVYEFAIGGGEPTTHPEFAKILEKLNSTANTVNFTTRSTKWMDDKEIVESVKDNVVGVAYSVENVADAGKFIAAHLDNIGTDVQLYLHVIPELAGEDELKNIIELTESMQKELPWGFRIHITLLGYKTTGRGSSQNPGKMKNLIDIIKSAGRTPIGIDTKIAQDYKNEIEEARISRKLYTDKEGEFSIYIDAVQCKAYKSSYELDEPVDVLKSRNKWGGNFYSLSEVFEKIRS